MLRYPGIMVYSTMPTYCYECECGSQFEKTYTPEEIDQGKKPTCPACQKRKTVYRNYGGESVSFTDGQPQTVGALADMNSKRMSTEEKVEIRRKQYTGRLPDGASTYIEDTKGKRIASRTQRNRDPKNGKTTN
jgi:hypothetical protein